MNASFINTSFNFFWYAGKKSMDNEGREFTIILDILQTERGID